MFFLYFSLYFGLTSLYDAIKAACILATLVTTTQLPHMMFSRQALGHFLIDHGYDVVVLVIGAVIMTLV